jgi:hypothetical protein
MKISASPSSPPASSIIIENDDSTLFDMRDWLTLKKLGVYYDQFIASGIDEKFHLLELKRNVGDDVSILKSMLVDAEIQIKPFHAITLLNALKDLD